MRPDEERVTRLVDAEARALLGYFTRRVDRSADAADLLGETMLVIWRRADTLPAGPTEARMWMYGVAARVLNQHRRGEIRRTALTERLRAELLDTDNRDPGIAVAVRTALASLNAVDAEINPAGPLGRLHPGPGRHDPRQTTWHHPQPLPPSTAAAAKNPERRGPGRGRGPRRRKPEGGRRGC